MAEQQILGTKKPKYQKPRKISFKVIKSPVSLGGGMIEPKKPKTPVSLGSG